MHKQCILGISGRFHSGAVELEYISKTDKYNHDNWRYDCNVIEAYWTKVLHHSAFNELNELRWPDKCGHSLLPPVNQVRYYIIKSAPRQ